MTDVSVQTEKLDIGGVIRQALGVLGRNLVTFLVLGVILIGIPSAVVGYLQLDVFRTVQDGGIPGFNFAALYGGLAYFIFSLILQGTLVYATVADLSGRRAPLPEALATGLRAFLPLLGLSILAGVAIVLGFMLLIVPGVMLALAWCVVTPALVVERLRVFDTFSRSAQLTRFNRWRIFGLGVLILVVSWIIGIVVGAAGLAASAITGGIESVVTVNAVVLSPLSNTLSGIIGATLISTLYVELRRLKEGADPTQLAAVFD